VLASKRSSDVCSVNTLNAVGLEGSVPTYKKTPLLCYK
jgi:hypothetical protein